MSSRKPLPELYHGTNVVLKAGDVISPPKSGPRSLTFAAEDPDFARGHAQRAAANDPLKSKHKDKDTAKYSKRGIVYKVEPVDADEVRKDRYGAPDGGVWVSKKGFKVHSVVSRRQLKG